MGKMQACETMGGANVVLTDRKGTLTQSRMRMVNWWDMSRKDPKIIEGNYSFQLVNFSDYIRPEMEELFKMLTLGCSVDDPVRFDKGELFYFRFS